MLRGNKLTNITEQLGQAAYIEKNYNNGIFKSKVDERALATKKKLTGSCKINSFGPKKTASIKVVNDISGQNLLTIKRNIEAKPSTDT